MKLKSFSILLLIIILSPFIYSNHYADIQIDVLSDGSVSIDGTTNYKQLLEIKNSQLYTSKNKNLWTFNLTINETFDNFIYELNLPEYSQINYIKTTPTFRIANDENRIQLIGTGENRALVIIVQYEINTPQKFISKYKYLLSGFGVFLLLIIILRLFGFKLKRIKSKNNKINDSNKDIENKKIQKEPKELENKIDYNLLSERQKDIVKILEKTKRLTQKELEEKMSIPKSSVSRNIRTLEIKEIIKKEKVGQTNYISLK